jgi:uncharacterized protein YutE (UPF0331/DUF86 family)
MSPVDRADFGRRALALRQAVSRLRRYATTVTAERLSSDIDTQYMVLHALYVAVQACIDLALQICADRRLTTDGTYRHAFRALLEAGLLGSDLAARMGRWASFRNVLAHFYPVVDLSKVHAALSEVGDLEAFADWAEASLET